MMYNAKQELLKINFSGKVPLIIDDDEINISSYNINEGSLYKLCNSILWDINKEYSEEGLIKRKSKLFSFLYKKPKAKTTAEASTQTQVQQSAAVQPQTPVQATTSQPVGQAQPSDNVNTGAGQ